MKRNITSKDPVEVQNRTLLFVSDLPLNESIFVCGACESEVARTICERDYDSKCYVCGTKLIFSISSVEVNLEHDGETVAVFKEDIVRGNLVLVCGFCNKYIIGSKCKEVGDVCYYCENDLLYPSWCEW